MKDLELQRIIIHNRHEEEPYDLTKFYHKENHDVRRRGVVGEPGSIPGGVRNFNFYPGTMCVYFVCVLSCVVNGDGPGIVRTIYSGRPAFVYLSSVLVQSLLLLLQATNPQSFEF